MTTPAERWGIVGGGMLGLALARGLAGPGRDITVLEREERLGGLARPAEPSTPGWDRYYHVVLPGDRRLQALLAELDLSAATQWRAARTGFYTDGRFHSLSDVLDYLRFPPLGLWDKARLGATLLWAVRRPCGASLEAQTAMRWLTRWSGRRAVDRIWGHLLRAKLGPAAEEASAAFIVSTIQRMYGARRGGQKRELLGAVEGGLGRVLARLGEALSARGVAIRTGREVTAVRRASPGGLAVATAAGEQWRFDRVVVTAAPPVAATLCPDLTPSERARCAGERYLGILCASVLLDAPPPPFYVTNITDPWVPFTALINMSALVGTAPFQGRSLLYLPKYVTSADPLLHAPAGRVRDEFTEALLRMLPSLRASDVAQFSLARDPYVMPLPVRHRDRHLSPQRTSVPGLSLLSSAHLVGVNHNLDETIGLAESALRWLAPAPAPGAAGRGGGLP